MENLEYIDYTKKHYHQKERQDFLKKEFNYYGTNGVAGLDGIWVEYTQAKV